MDGAAPIACSATTLHAIDHIAIAVPVRNEAARLPKLLSALGVAAAMAPLPVRVLMLVNNTTDASAAIARAFDHPALEVQVATVDFAPEDASAGRARGLAMRMAAMSRGLLMTTDADTVPDPMWIASALNTGNAGADLVCGRIAARVPRVIATPSGARITNAERSYSLLLHEIRHRMDQVAGRQAIGSARPHYMESGACMAIRADAFISVGGLPDLHHSEDRAMVHRAEMGGLVVRYCDAMKARVSGRLRGRAIGGMAECLRQRMSDADPLADQAMLPPELLAKLWRDAMAGRGVMFPDRSRPHGPQMRASDLEAALPVLTHLFDETIRPQFDDWQSRNRVVAA
ncbi:glycosyltransferase family 2 protein [Paracoccus sp. 1_MG-2023]|uniref:glycosyltransferase n=1 Tax=unclassified Paracoccus (in: a-proteobacteria) TaxID=2688777 RepID=UPI001C0A332B|nr:MULTISPECIES: glycosyltransferase family 2 protein [unclassified Paracoccus (in: a-proteobacteria)]MBU2957623.1 glycosyltransferase family 2 protein [Paracoccus sp. C2R09]MDO6667530.1 glycosyltransferase family 2 protein [Paracoccus sp. 1_MG-2023]